jgi:prepilin-type N-terminal cleavage/methylation domain-containing protein
MEVSLATGTRGESQNGFSFLELMFVAAAISVIVAIAPVPNMISSAGISGLRSSMTSLAGVLQECRMLAVKQNRTMSTHFASTTHGSLNGLLAYVKRAADPNPIFISDSQVQLEEPVIQVGNLSGKGAPVALDSTILGFTPRDGDPSFTPTGLPCAYSNGNCINSGFVYYFRDASQTEWAAISISLAGRLKKWYWNGGTWTE